MYLVKFSSMALTLALHLALPAIGQEKASLPKEQPFKLAEIEQGQVAQLRDSGKKPAQSGPLMYRISGQVSAASKSSLAFRVPGSLQKIVAKPGDLVKKGEILALLDPVDFELQLSLAKANKSQAQIQENMAKTEFNREKQLKLEGASTGSQLEHVEFKYKQAQIGTQLADINVKIADRNLAHTKLRAPYDCIVAEKFKDIGEHVGGEGKAFDVYEINSTEVNLNVPEIFIDKLQIGSRISISVPSVNYIEETVVSKVVPIVSEKTRTFRVTAILKNNRNKVVPGLFAEAQIN